jgi:HD superfamily phosphohydrolase YqeK
MKRVSELLGAWAEGLALGDDDASRWRAAGLLHDALRDEDASVLRTRVPPYVQNLPDPLLHGPAAAERLRIEGVLDGELLTAVGWHTVGDPRFGPLGRALFAADFLEPGRAYRPEWRSALRDRMPHEIDQVVIEVARARMVWGLEQPAPVLERTVAFWNRLVGGER